MSDERVAPWAVAIVALVLGVCEVWPATERYTWINRDGRFYVNMLATITEHGSLRQDEFAASWYSGHLFWNRDLDAGWSNVALGADGHRYPKHSWMLPALAWPLYFAAGLWGTLAFNLLVFAAAGLAAYRYARAYTGPAPAAVAAIALLYASGVRDYAYDFHVDVLLMGITAIACASAVARRGLAAGLVIGTGVLLRPTTLAVALPVAFLLIERRAYRELGRAVLGGIVMLSLGAVVNWILFGRPWWTGYNRILVVEHGVPHAMSITNSFTVPLRDGMKRSWEGGLGLRTRMTVFAAAAPGLLILLKRRPWMVAGAVLFAAVFFLVFSKYEYEGDRFHWPTCVVLVPALAATFSALARAVRRWPKIHAPLVAFVGGGALAALSLPLVPGGEALLAAPQEAAKHVLAAAGAAAVIALVLAPLRGPAVLAACTVAPLIVRALRERIATDYHVLPWVAAAAIVSVLLVRFSATRVARLAVRIVAVRRAIVLTAVLVSVALVAGVVRNVAEIVAPFRLSNERTVRHLAVYAGDTPCDFLAWEHFSWECSHLDNGVQGEVGLALPEGVTVGGRRRHMLLVPSAQWGASRRVVVDLPSGTRALRLVWAVPDGALGGMPVELRAGAGVIDHFDVPQIDTAALHTRRVAIPAGAHTLEIDVLPPVQRGRTAVALDATVDAR